MFDLELWNSLPYFYGFGGKLADKEFTRTNGYLNSEESIHAVETMFNLYKEKLINPNLLDDSGDLWSDIYASWDTFMIDEGPWYYSILLQQSED